MKFHNCSRRDFVKKTTVLFMGVSVSTLLTGLVHAEGDYYGGTNTGCGGTGATKTQCCTINGNNAYKCTKNGVTRICNSNNDLKTHPTTGKYANGCDSNGNFTYES